MITIKPGSLTLDELRLAYFETDGAELDPAAISAIAMGAAAVERIAEKGDAAYGINTGFGRLANTRIARDQLELLQRNLVLSHAVGIGDPLPVPVVRLMMLLKVASLARGYSGITPAVVDALLALLNRGAIPVIPSKGSVGASGDLAPLAHMAAVLLGVGEVWIDGRRRPAREGLALAGLEPMALRAKEGLALLNGTQCSTAIALAGLFKVERLFGAAIVSGSMSVDAAAGSLVPFDARIHDLRGHQGQIDTARTYLQLLTGSQIALSHQDCEKVQDPYSLRCQPQVMGACLDVIRTAGATLLTEANSVSDNPLVFADTTEVLSGGNFHAEPVAFAADMLSIAASEIGALAERRIALLIDSSLSGLPPFLVKDGGVNSGFMIAHVTAASLASENKTLAHPASVDSLPTSANQEDHVSMATFAARKLGDIAANVAGIIAIELLAAAQGIDLRAPYATSPGLAPVMELIRAHVPHYDIDHYLAADIERAQTLVEEGSVSAFSPLAIFPKVTAE